MADEWDDDIDTGKPIAPPKFQNAAVNDDDWGDDPAPAKQENSGWGGGGGNRDKSNWSNDRPRRNENGFGSGGGGGGGGRQPRQGDWTCPDSSCNNSNFGFRKECQKCQTPKPETNGDSGDRNGGGFGDRNGGGGGRPKRQGDWTCPDSSCNNSNFGFRTECQKCQTPKPDGDQNGSFTKRGRDDGTKAEGEDGFRAEKPKEFYIPPELDEAEIFKTGISTGINFEKYNDIPVKVTGEDVPPPCTSFEDSGLDPFLQNNIKRANYTKPTPIQKYAMPIILKGRDLMGCAQTGSGKTAAFLLPIINTLLIDNKDCSIGKPHVVIVSPTRELAIQIYNEARKFSSNSIIKTCVVYGGTATRHQSTNIAKGCHILVATPGRLQDFTEKGFVTFEDLRFFVLDEADRMLDLGFMPAVKKIMENPTMVPLGQRQTLMFSATFPEDIQRLAGEFLQKYLFLTVGIVGGACSDVEQVIYEVGKYEKRNKLMEILDSEDPRGTMVFVETRRNADFLASFLSESKHPTTSIHGDRVQRQREEALADFKNNRMKVLIATSVAARGLDIPNVQHVINYDLPKSIDDYVHRIGRTGRVGNRGKSTSFYDNEQDSALAPDLVRILKQAGQTVPEFLLSGGGGGGNYEKKSFGGRDVRSSAPEPHAAGGAEEEEW